MSEMLPSTSRRNEWIFPVTVGVVVLLVVIVFHQVTGVGLGFRGQAAMPELGPSGFVGNIHDNFSYAAWAQQARQGEWTFYNPYTNDDHRAIYTNTFFLIAGRVSRLFNAQPFFTMHIMGLIGAFVSVVGVYAIARTCGFERAACRWACVLFAFALGVSGPVGIIAKLLGVPLINVLGADVRCSDSFGFNCFLTLPYHSFTWGVFTLTVLAVISTVARCADRGPGPGRLVVIGLMMALMASMRPYEPVMISAAFGMYAAGALFFRDQRRQWRRLLTIGAVMVLAALPLLLYNLWVSRQPVWSHFAHRSLFNPVPRWSWVIGLGAFLPLGAVGAVRTFKSTHLASARLLALWAALVVFLLVVIGTSRVKVASSVMIPISVLAGGGMVSMVAWLRQHYRPLTVKLVAGVVVVFCFMTTPAFVYALKGNVTFQKSAYQLDPLRAAEEARRLVGGGVPRLLCDRDPAMWLPAVSGVRVYLGHASLTPDADRRVHLLRDGGFQADLSNVITAEPPTASISFEAFVTLLEDARPQFVLTTIGSPAHAFAGRERTLRRVGSFGRFELFSRN